MGFMLVIFSPFLDLTHSLLMKRPIGCLYLRPLGAVSSISRSDMLASGCDVCILCLKDRLVMIVLATLRNELVYR